MMDRESCYQPAPGFSLLEIIIVVMVTAILSGILYPGLLGIQRWLAVNQSVALFSEIEYACRVYRMEQGDWPEAFAAGELKFNDLGAGWRKAIARHMETQVAGIVLADGFGNTDLRLLVDVDGDHWIHPEAFIGLTGEELPDKLWARVVLYSLDGEGRLAVKNW